MTFVSLLFVFISSVCAASASVLLRLDGTGALPNHFLFANIAFKIVALGAYGVGFLFYMLALAKTEVRIAYPVMVSMTVIQLFIWSAVMESTPDFKALVGIFFILTGIFLTVR